MVLAQLSDSKLADNAPELVGAAVLIALTIAGIWRLVSKLQEGQREMVAQFLGHIERSDAKNEQMALDNRTVLQRVQKSLDSSTMELGRSSAALERAIRIIETFEQKKGE